MSNKAFETWWQENFAWSNLPKGLARRTWQDATLADSERCAKMLEFSAENTAPEGQRTNQYDRHMADVLRRHANAIRARGDK